MTSDFTDQGRYMVLDAFYRNAAIITSTYYLALVTDTPDNDTTTLSELTEVSDGGYTTGGLAVTPATEFDNPTEGSSTASLQIADQQWTATTAITATYAVLTDDNGTVGSRKVMAYFAVSGTASAGQTYTVQDCQMDFNLDSGKFTDKGMYTILTAVFDGATEPTNLYLCLIRASSAPTVSTNTLGELTQINGGTGYTTNGYQLSRNSTDFDSLADGTNQAEIQMKDIVWTASGDNLDGSGGAGARYVVMTDDNGTPSSRLVLNWWDMSTSRNVSDGNTLTLADFEIDFTT